jgi:hypothetical protein
MQYPHDRGPIPSTPSEIEGFAAIAEWPTHRAGLAWHAARRFEHADSNKRRFTPLKGLAMKATLKITWITLLIAAASAGAHAQASMPKTRAEVRQELAEALRNGAIARGDQELPIASAPMAAARTRAEVRAELEAARRSGDLLADGESSLKQNELHPSMFPQRTVVATRTRAQVQAELAEAQRNGDIVAAGESGLKLNEIHPGLYSRPAAPVFASAPASQAAR